MSFSGAGVFNINSTGQPVVAGTTISSSTFNALTADLATGLSTCITKDGQQTVTANIPFANYRLTAVGAGTAATDAANVGQVQSRASGLITVTGTDTLVGTMSPTLSAYATGNQFAFVAANTNTTTVTLNIDGLGAKAVTRDGSTALVAGDITANKAHLVVYDGTRFQLLNSPSFTDLKATTLAVSGATTLSSNVTIAAPASGTALLVNNKGGSESGVNVTAPAATQNIAFSANGSTTAAALVQLTNATGITYLGSESSTGGSLATGTSAYSTVISTGTAAVSIHLATNNTVRQTITSAGNVGIGTASPATRLQSASDVTDPNVGQILASGVTDTNKRLSMGFHTTSNYGFIQALIAGTNTYDLVLQPNGSNLGLGVTPSAWTSGAKALQIKSYSALFESNAGQTTLSFNARESAANVYSYLQTEYAAMYRQVSGVHYWLNAPSGTAGNTITFTQAMTLDASGNLGIGTTPSSKLHVLGTAAGTAALRLDTTATTGAQTATWTAPTNKPGAASGVVSKWIPVNLDGTTYYIPAWT